MIDRERVTVLVYGVCKCFDCGLLVRSTETALRAVPSDKSACPTPLLSLGTARRAVSRGTHRQLRSTCMYGTCLPVLGRFGVSRRLVKKSPVADSVLSPLSPAGVFNSHLRLKVTTSTPIAASVPGIRHTAYGDHQRPRHSEAK